MPQTNLYTSASKSCHLTALRDASDGKSKARETGGLKYIAKDFGWSGLIQPDVSQGVMRKALEDANEYRML